MENRRVKDGGRGPSFNVTNVDENISGDWWFIVISQIPNCIAFWCEPHVQIVWIVWIASVQSDNEIFHLEHRFFLCPRTCIARHCGTTAKRGRWRDVRIVSSGSLLEV